MKKFRTVLSILVSFVMLISSSTNIFYANTDVNELAKANEEVPVVEVVSTEKVEENTGETGEISAEETETTHVEEEQPTAVEETEELESEEPVISTEIVTENTTEEVTTESTIVEPEAETTEDGTEAPENTEEGVYGVSYSETGNEYHTTNTYQKSSLNLRTLSAVSNNYTVDFSTNNNAGVAYYNYKYAFDVLTLINNYRADNGVAPVQMDQNLLEAAMRRSIEVYVNFDNTRPNGTNFSTIKDEVNPNMIPIEYEKLAYGYPSPNMVMIGWKGSAVMRANLLNPDWKSIGVGVAGPESWSHMFSTGTATPVTKAAYPDRKNITQSVQVNLQNAKGITVDGIIGNLKAGTTIEFKVAMRNYTYEYSQFDLNRNQFTITTNSTNVAVEGTKLRLLQPGAFTVTLQHIPTGRTVTYANTVLQSNENPGTPQPIKQGWVTEDGKVYYYINNVKVTGWQTIDDEKFYFNTSGVMQIGWQKIDNKWYYFFINGIMLTGFQTISGKQYYLDTTGVMQTGWQLINNKWYYFKADGAMLIGWQLINNKWYYLNNSGIMLTGWQLINNKWYYLNDSGMMLTGWQLINAKWYYLNESGAMITGWLEIAGKTYYLNVSGVMVTGVVTIDGVAYIFNASGVLLGNA